MLDGARKPLALGADGVQGKIVQRAYPGGRQMGVRHQQVAEVQQGGTASAFDDSSLMTARVPAGQVHTDPRGHFGFAVDFVHDLEGLQAVEGVARVHAVSAVVGVAGLARFERLNPDAGVRKHGRVGADDATRMIQVEVRQHDPVDRGVGDTHLGQAALELGFAFQG